jgi:hypothetical protein
MIRMVLVSCAVLALSACASQNPLLVTRTSCPAVAVIKYANTITGFRQGGGMDQSDVDFTGQISNVSVDCRNGKGDNAAQSVVSFDIGVLRRSANAAATQSIPYFVAVVQDGTTIISKTSYMATLQFNDKNGRSIARESFAASTPGVPLPPVPKKKRSEAEFLDEAESAAKAAKYEILIGFQLTDAQALFNISK